MRLAAARRLAAAAAGAAGRRRAHSVAGVREVRLPGGAGGAAPPGLARLVQVPARQDNYVYVAEAAAGGHVAVIDPCNAHEVQRYLESDAGPGRVDTILCTHHHHDHTGGIEELKARYGSRVVCGELTRDRVPAWDEAVPDGGRAELLPGLEVRCLDTPGHTRDHCSFYAASARLLFCGDTSFSLGCGRVFDGTAAQLRASLRLIAAAVPEDALLVCAHEYTRANGAFAVAEAERAGNGALADELREYLASLREGEPSVPTTLAFEARMNPFYAAAADPDPDVFAAARARKDVY